MEGISHAISFDFRLSGMRDSPNPIYPINQEVHQGSKSVNIVVSNIYDQIRIIPNDSLPSDWFNSSPKSCGRRCSRDAKRGCHIKRGNKKYIKKYSNFRMHKMCEEISNLVTYCIKNYTYYPQIYLCVFISCNYA